MNKKNTFYIDKRDILDEIEQYEIIKNFHQKRLDKYVESGLISEETKNSIVIFEDECFQINKKKTMSRWECD